MQGRVVHVYLGPVWVVLAGQLPWRAQEEVCSRMAVAGNVAQLGSDHSCCLNCTAGPGHSGLSGHWGQVFAGSSPALPSLLRWDKEGEEELQKPGWL